MQKARGCAALLSGLALAVAGSALPAQAAGSAPRGDLSALWWQVALTTEDFFVDGSGANCVTVELPSGPLVLAAGTLGGQSALRTCTVPAGATVVVPVINSVEWTPDPPLAVDSIGEARAANRAALAEATWSATLDGRPAPVRRLMSSRFLLDVSLFLGSPSPVVLPSVAEGYFVVFTARSGSYAVTTSGTADGDCDPFCTGTQYTFRVVD